MAKNLVEATLTELSKGTLGSYVKKAAGDAMMKATQRGAAWDRAANQSSREQWQKGNEISMKVGKRAKGIQTAVDKLTKEELEELTSAIVESLADNVELTEEQLQELSRGTLASYTKKAAMSMTKSTSKGDAGTAIKRLKGINASTAKLAKEEIEPLTDEDLAELEASGIDTLTLEEFQDLVLEAVEVFAETFESDKELTEEQLQELSKATLKSYVKKAEKSGASHLRKADEREDKAMSTDGTRHPERQAAHTAQAKKHFNKFVKREKGVAQARYTLTKEELEVGDTIIEALSDLYDLTEEQLDELSKSTLKSYVEKAATKRGDTKKVWKRTKKVKAASDSLKEGEELEVEELSEEAIEFFGDFMESLAENIELSEEDVETLAEKYALWRPEEHGANHKGVVTKRGSEKAARARVETRKKSSEFQAKLSDVAKSGESYAVRRRKEKIASAKAALKKEDLDDELLDLIAEEATIIVEALEDIFDLTEEQLQELSKGTLKSYVSKARTSQMAASKASAEHSAKGDNYGQSPAKRQAHWDKVAKAENTWSKRQKGIKTAKSKLKEEFEDVAELFLESLVENIELSEEDLVELSKATLGSYATKALQKATTAASQYGDHSASASAAKHDPRGRNDRRSSDHLKGADRAEKKWMKREKGVRTAIAKLAKEDFSIFEGEDLQELSKNKLGDYVRKASLDLSNRSFKDGRKPTGSATDPKALKRVRGITVASLRMQREEEETFTLLDIIAESFDLTADEVVEVIESLEEENLQELDSLQELSRDTLISYAKKASSERKTKNQNAAMHTANANTGRDPAWHKVRAKIAKSVARKRGEKVSLAHEKIKAMKEEIENIQELSSETLQRYKKRASEEAKHAKPAKYGAGAHKDNTTHLRTAAWRSENRRGANEAKKIFDKRTKGVAAADAKLKEEVKDIQELSKDTLLSYVKKAHEQNKATKNTAKRLEGSSKAHAHYEKLTGKSHAGAIAKNDAEKAKVERVRPKRLAKVEQARTKIKQLAKEGVELDEGRQPSEYELELRRAKLSRLGERFRKKMAQELKAIEEA